MITSCISKKLRDQSRLRLDLPVTRTCSRQTATHNDNFEYNQRSELTNASLGTTPYAYTYDNIGNRIRAGYTEDNDADGGKASWTNSESLSEGREAVRRLRVNIGNRKTAQEIAEEISYDANNINQYSSITRKETAFVPTFDTDGNQTLVQTSTGIWSVAYNADNRPVSFTKTEADQTTLIECVYDYMGRRSMKKVSVNGTLSLHLRYIYRGYLQIACVDLMRNGHPALWLTMWDPGEPVATRPLAIQKNATWYTYAHDLTKNVTELYKTDGTIATTYDYTPYGAVTAKGIDQPFQWSSEVFDAELDMVYYNYRHYNPMDGRWIGRDTIAEQGGYNLYVFVGNSQEYYVDFLGEYKYPRNSDGGVTPPDNRPKIDPSRNKQLPPMNPQRGGKDVGGAGTEVIDAASLILAKDVEEAQMICRSKCSDYIKNNDFKFGCSCCFCLYGYFSVGWGHVRRLSYYLQLVAINPNIKCGVIGLIPREILYDRKIARTIVYDQFGNPTGRDSDSFNV